MTTVTTTASTSGTANGTAPIPFTFQAISAAEVGVERAGVEVTTGFTVTLNGDSTGSVTPDASWGTDPVVIFSKPSYQQPAEFTRFGALYPDAINPALDRQARATIALRDKVDRAILVGRGEPVPTYADILALIDAITVSGGSITSPNTINVFDFMSTAEKADVTAGTLTLNVTHALRDASAALEAQDGGTLLVPPGRYLVGEQTPHGTLFDGVTPAAYGPTRIIKAYNCTMPVRIAASGAVLKVAPGLRYGAFDPVTLAPAVTVVPFYDYSYFASAYGGMIDVQDNACVIIDPGVELDGSLADWIIGGFFGDSGWQIGAHGIWAMRNDQYYELGVNAHHQPSDGRVIGYSGLTDASPPKPHVLINSIGRYCGRQGLSLVGGNQVTIINPDYSNTGKVNVPSLGGLMQSTPGCGLDIEAEGTVIRNVEIINPKMVGNWRRGIISASGNSRHVSVRGGKIENVVIGRPDFRFMDVTFIGYTEFALSSEDQYKATTNGVNVTITGAGPYVITRNSGGSGSYITDGFAVGSSAIMVGGGLNAANSGKNLIITALTATAMTVIPANGIAMVAEGPIAGVVINTARTAADAIHCRRCLFTYDASLTESGVLNDAAQSQWGDALNSVFSECVIDTKDTILPSSGIGGRTIADLRNVVFENCVFRSIYNGAHGCSGFYRGVNRYETLTSPTATLGFGTFSQIDYGYVTWNGAVQGVQAYTATNVTTDRTFDADAAVVTETNDILGTLIADLRDRRLIG